MMRAVQQMIAVASKDIRSELRTRYAINAMGMFVVVVVVTIVFAIGVERISPPLTAALLWISFFFSSVTGLARTFLIEEERSTLLLLRVTIPSTPVYFGKLLYNVLLALIANCGIILLFMLFMPEAYRGDLGSLFVVTILVSLGLASALTIVSAIIARTSARSSLTAVLAFPVVLPIVLLGVEMLTRGAAGRGLGVMTSYLLLTSAYVVVSIAISYILFDLLWKE